MMKTLLRSLAVTAGAVLALAVVYAALLWWPAPQATGRQEGQGVVFSAAEPVEIASVAVKNGAGAYRYFYEGDGYVLDDIPATIADLDAFIRFLVGCGRLSAIRRVDAAALSAYGLEPPSAAVEIVFFSGDTLRLSIGERETISGDYYVAAEGFPGVYLMASSMAEPFLLPKTHVISKYVTPPLAVSSPLSAIRDITFSGGPLEQPVAIQAVSGGDAQVRLAALSFGTATHIVRGAGVYPLDQTYGVEILRSLFGIPALDVVDYNLSEADIAAMGFDNPWMMVEYDMFGGVNAEMEHRALKLVRLQDDAFYVALDGSGVVFLIGRQPFMDIRYDKLPLRRFLSPMLMDLSAVTVEGGGQRYRFEIDNADAKNPVVTCDGEVLDVQLFRSLFRLLTSAAHDGVYLGEMERPEMGELLSVTYEYIAPSKEPDVLSLYPGGVRRADVFVNGVGEYAMKDQFAVCALEGCESLLGGQLIEESW